MSSATTSCDARLFDFGPSQPPHEMTQQSRVKLRCIHRWIEEQAGRTPDAVALPPDRPVKRAADLRRDLEKMATVARGIEVLEYREVFEETLVFGDTAVEWGHIEGSERDRATGEVTTSRFHLMRILRRMEDGTWRVHRSIFAPSG